MWATSKDYMHRDAQQRGFTIVELLIVIVVIGILAAITIVAFNGVQSRAKQASAQTAVAQANKKVLAYAALNSDLYPPDLATAGVYDSDTKFEYSYNNAVSPRTFGITGTNGAFSYFMSNAVTAPTVGSYQGHGNGGVAAITNLATNPHAVLNGWGNQTPAGSTISYVANGAQDNGSTYQLVTTQAGQLRISTVQSVGSVSPGDVIAVSMDINAPISTTAQIELGVSSTFPKSPVFTVPAGWSRIYGEVTIPAGTTPGAVSLVQLTTTGSIPTGQTWKATRALITKGSHTSAYGDGFSQNWLWNGNPNASTSTGSPLN